MAKQIKVFDGSSTTSVTIYTVPAGRIAKVVAEQVILSASANGPATMSVGAQTVFSAAVGRYYHMPAPTPMSAAVASGFQLIVDRNMRVASSGGNVSLQKGVYYLNAGQTIQVTLYSGGTVSWSFLVIEEY